jgi:Fur family peroxide stress response transcriptional regulator
MDFVKLKEILVSKGMKITPQRLAVLEALVEMSHHPKAEDIIEYIRQNHPNIATGTVYKTLETFVDKNIIKRVKTDKDVMRYDAILDHHHHLYCSASDRIEDYFDDDLNALLIAYFEKKNIPDFEVEDIRLEIKGKFNKS